MLQITSKFNVSLHVKTAVFKSSPTVQPNETEALVNLANIWAALQPHILDLVHSSQLAPVLTESNCPSNTPASAR